MQTGKQGSGVSYLDDKETGKQGKATELFLTSLIPYFLTSLEQIEM